MRRVAIAAAGRGLGRVLSLTESGTGDVPVYAKAGAAADSTPIVAGEQEITASVSVTFRLL